jgi:hypothetical protein
MGPGRLWERALLAVGDFLPIVGRNRSLLTTSYDDPWGWKRLLRNAASGGRASQFLKALWDRLERPGSYEADLGRVIDAASEIDPWREAILATPSAYDYGTYRMIRFSDDGGVYLLRKTQMNGRHAELFTYCLYEGLASDMEPYGFETRYFEATSTDEEPGLYFVRVFDGEVAKFRLCLNEAPDWYELCLEEPRGPKDELISILEGVGFVNKEGRLSKDVKRSDIKPQVLVLARAFAQET